MNPAKVAFYYAQSMRTYGLSRSELDRLQVRKLRAVLTYADRRVPGCHEMFAKANFDPATLTKVEDLRKLPLRSKDEMVKLTDAARESGRAKGAKLTTTSGTTGKPSMVATSSGANAIAYGIRFRKRTKWGMRPWSRVATLWAPERYWRQEMVDGEMRPMTGVRRFPMSLLGRNPPNLFPLFVDPWDPAKDGKALSAFRPQFIQGKPSHLRRIAKYCGKDFQLAPKAVLVTGEVVTESGLKEIRRGFQTKVLQHYGSSGFGGLATDCLHETGLHVVEDYKICEVLKDGEPVSEGEIGEVVVTKLYPDVVPAIRFRTGDYVRLGPVDRCECGSSTRRFRSIEGREGDCIVTADGEKIMALQIADHIESEFGLRDFQLQQIGLQSFTFLLSKTDLESGADVTGVVRYIEGLMGCSIELKTQQRSDEDFWLKYRPVISKVVGSRGLAIQTSQIEHN